MQSELKPCPFCGGEAERRVNATFGDMSMVSCRSCGAQAYDRKWDMRSAGTNGERALPYDRDTLGRFVREAWVRWAETQPTPKPSWLVPYDQLSEADKEADRQIGESVSRWTLIGDAALTAALSAEQTQPVAVDDLDARMKAAGMYTVAEMMGVTPLTKWKSNPAINDLDAFSDWLDRKVSEYLTMKAGYDLGDKSTDDELYEWVEAHAAVFGTIRDQFQVVRSALVDVPVEPEAWSYEYHDFGRVWSRHVILNRPGGGANPPTKHHGSPVRNVRPLYTSPPLSREGEDSAEVERIIADLRHAASSLSDRLQQTQAIDNAIAFLAATRSGSATNSKGHADE
jgi:hypothetical protein